MKDIFEILPENHFGTAMDKTILALVGGESVCAYCMPGGGMHYFLKIAQRILEGDYEASRNPSPRRQSLWRRTAEVPMNIGTKGDQNLKTFFFDGNLYPTGLNRVIRQTLSQELRFNSQVDFYQQLQTFLKTKKIIILLGHVNEVLEKQPKTLEYLLKLRDYYPTRLAVLSNCDHSIISNFNKYFSLGKTIFSNQIKIPPFDLAGTKRVLEINREILGYKFSSSTLKKIHQLSGGNPSLIKHLGKCVDELGQQALSQTETLINYPSLKIKLNDINEVILREPREVLIQIGIINENGKLFSPLVKEYLKIYELENIEEIVPCLTLQERRILTYFIKNKGKIIDKDRIFFWMGLAEEKYSLWAIYKAISRLKSKIKSNYKLRNIKDRGYILESARFQKTI